VRCAAMACHHLRVTFDSTPPHGSRRTTPSARGREVATGDDPGLGGTGCIAVTLIQASSDVRLRVDGVNRRTQGNPMGPDGTRHVVLAATGFRLVPTGRPSRSEEHSGCPQR
jgi:hypothetical protein